MVGQNKHENSLYRKRWRRGERYICCAGAPGNANKMSKGFSCTAAPYYRRLDASVSSRLEADGRMHILNNRGAFEE